MTNVFRWVKLSLLTVAFLSSTSCTINKDPVSVNYTDTSTKIISTLTKEDPIIPATLPTPTIDSGKKVEIKKIKIGCSKFVLPDLKPEVILTESDLIITGKDRQKELTVIFMTHIRKMHEQNVANEQLLKEAINKHLKSCVGY